VTNSTHVTFSFPFQAVRVGSWVTNMKYYTLSIAVLFFARIASAQQGATIPMQCHDLASNYNFVGPDETIVNGMACRQVKLAAAQPAASVAPASNSAAPNQVTSAPLPAQAAEQAPAPAPRVNDGKVRLFVTDEAKDESIFLAAHHSGWQVNGNSSGRMSGSFVNGTGSINGSSDASVRGSGGSAGASYGYSQKGADPRTVEVQADLYKKCPSIVVTNDPARADYVLLFRREGGKRSSMFAFGGLMGLAFSAHSKVDGASVFDTNGDMVVAIRARTVEGAIKEVCPHLK
jgi:hypothetical protein